MACTRIGSPPPGRFYWTCTYSQDDTCFHKVFPVRTKLCMWRMCPCAWFKWMAHYQAWKQDHLNQVFRSKDTFKHAGKGEQWIRVLTLHQLIIIDTKVKLWSLSYLLRERAASFMTWPWPEFFRVGNGHLNNLWGGKLNAKLKLMHWSWKGNHIE